MRYIITLQHGENGTIFNVIDSDQPMDEQPCIVQSWNTATEPNAKFLANDFCRRHNR